MHILVIPSFFADPDNPLRGIFFREQAVELARTETVGMVHLEARRLRNISWGEVRRSHFQVGWRTMDGVQVLIRHGWNPHVQSALGGAIWSMLTCRLAAKYVESRGRPDVIHAQCALWAGVAARRVARVIGVPYVITEHHSGVLTGGVPSLQTKAMRAAYRDAAKVTAVGTNLARAIAFQTGRRDVAITPNLLPRGFVVSAATRDGKAGRRFLAVGSLVSEKRFDLLINAFADVVRLLPHATLTIAGDGELRTKLQELATSRGVAQKVSFVGEVARASVIKLMQESDVLVVSSDVETFSIVTIEALACGLRVIATRCGGPEDILEEGRYGVLVPTGDVRALARAMSENQHLGWLSPEILTSYVAHKYGPNAFANRFRGVFTEAMAVGLNK